MAKGGGGASRTNGWGQYNGWYLSIPLVNRVIAGGSARRYADEGRFATLINIAWGGDFVVIEFSHNDKASGAIDNGRENTVGVSYDTTATVTEAEYVFTAVQDIVWWL